MKNIRCLPENAPTCNNFNVEQNISKLTNTGQNHHKFYFALINSNTNERCAYSPTYITLDQNVVHMGNDTLTTDRNILCV